MEEHVEVTRDMRAHGVRFINGLDMGMAHARFDASSANARAFVKWFDYTPWQAVAASTVESAEAMRLGHETGAIRPGLAADLMSVAGDPAVDIAALGHAVDVIQAGRPVKLGAAPPRLIAGPPIPDSHRPPGGPMAFRINHIHLKAPDPRKTADWYVKAFHFKIVSDETRRLRRPVCPLHERGRGHGGEHLGCADRREARPGDAMPHHGLEHFGFDSANLDADIARLAALGCPVLEGPIQVPNGPRIAFVRGPDDARIELIEPPKKPAVSGGCC